MDIQMHVIKSRPRPHTERGHTREHSLTLADRIQFQRGDGHVPHSQAHCMSLYAQLERVEARRVEGVVTAFANSHERPVR